ncbi:hypothetical protein [Thermotalea metallivorans]|uniref:Phage protein n=1 Tax=Thermotalea metallivorans TaxID=520762 RepID=A0A140LCK8_9FIRM|nr:hypothetical protein [Thermotalea metallivorans]KXG78283.1 hypothetical protein AN619_02580 [Thermotalea metallivorans]
MNVFALARKSIESTYTGHCSIVEYKEVKDPVSKITKHEEVIVLENQPCRLSYDNISTTKSTESAHEVSQTIKLFIASEVEIKAGSKLVINQNGTTKAYECSGEPAIYPTHQEINLKLFKGWA